MLTVIVKEFRVAREVKGKMVEGAALLLAQKGLQATSFSEVLNLTGAPRGSVYHHFPEGKDQLVAAALDLVAGRMLEGLDEQAGRSPEAVVEYVVRMWRLVLTRSEFSAGCAVLAVTVAAESTELVEHVAGIFRAWRGRLAELFVAGGVDPPKAKRFAATVIAATEGAVVMARAERSLEPFEQVAAELSETARALSPGRRSR
jgi:TetR/AcrR family transcriptional regulator, lmrAB and yxaGH operons repressor